ncbi:MAG: PIG-L family deacetylase [Gammaproteobacteria bacterium]|nr:PIG-L family deacetylase [Gammaproteobacteria bacterium]
MTDNVVVIAAHPDDEVLGCGGTIIKHVESGDSVSVIILADGEASRGKKEQKRDARHEELKMAAKILGVSNVSYMNYPDQKMDIIPFLDIVQSIEKALEKLSPTIIYTHHGGDLNLDHKITYRAVMTACRPLPDSKIKGIYSFEVVSSTEWGLSTESQFRPTKACDITVQLDKKIEALKCYKRELREFPHPRSIEGVIGLAKTRGMQFGLDAAEVFIVERTFWR